MLDNVWSVRKDVRVNTNAVKASDVGGKSFYSRHGRVSGKYDCDCFPNNNNNIVL